jgi:small subunit ribosomal protein S9
VTDAEHPEDEQRNEEAEASADEAQTPPEAPAPETELPPTAAAETPEEPEQAPAPPAEAEESPAPVPEAEESPAEAEEAQEAPAPAVEAEEAQEAPAPAVEAEEAHEAPAEAEDAQPESSPPPAVPAADAPAPAAPAAEAEEVELTPRQRPEIPGADLIPDIVSESDEFLDAEARAAAEAEAEEAARQDQDTDQEEEARPIADAAIDLAAGARYTATGKRKTAVARVILKPGTGTYSINGKDLDTFFPRDTLRRVIRQPLETVGYEARMDVIARMHGGGVAAQAGALRHGISRALLVADPNLRGELKRRGFLTRDPRVKERKKAGLKKARKRPQFSKR